MLFRPPDRPAAAAGCEMLPQMLQSRKLHCHIIDKDVNVPEGTVIGYDPEEDKRRFKYISPGGIVVIPKGAHITPPKQGSRAAVPPHG